MLFAVVMLGWHNVWMKRHGREMAQHMRDMGEAVMLGSRSMTMLAVVIGLAVLREGSEVVLFLYGVAIAQQDSPGLMLSGGLIGLLSGAMVGLLMYRGLLRISSRYLFTVTTWMITLLAAGMAAQAAGFLTQADLLPPLVQSMWDTSGIVAQNSILGGCCRPWSATPIIRAACRFCFMPPRLPASPCSCVGMATFPP